MRAISTRSVGRSVITAGFIPDAAVPAPVPMSEMLTQRLQRHPPEAPHRHRARHALRRLDLLHGRQAVAVAFHWDGSATFFRLQAFSSGIAEGLKEILAKGHPLVLVNDGDIGGIVGLHFREELQLEVPIISIDGIALSDFDYIDIGALIPSSGAVPVVIKSLIFPTAPQN